MRWLGFLPLLPAGRRKRSTGILPIDPREQELLDRQRAAREIREDRNP